MAELDPKTERSKLTCPRCGYPAEPALTKTRSIREEDAYADGVADGWEQAQRALAELAGTARVDKDRPRLSLDELIAKVDHGRERSMRRAARAVLDTPGLVERLADACMRKLGREPDDADWMHVHVATAIREACEETAREGE